MDRYLVCRIFVGKEVQVVAGSGWVLTVLFPVNKNRGSSRFALHRHSSGRPKLLALPLPALSMPCLSTCCRCTEAHPTCPLASTKWSTSLHTRASSTYRCQRWGLCASACSRGHRPSLPSFTLLFLAGLLGTLCSVQQLLVQGLPHVASALFVAEQAQRFFELGVRSGAEERIEMLEKQLESELHTGQHSPNCCQALPWCCSHNH